MGDCCLKSKPESGPILAVCGDLGGVTPTTMWRKGGQTLWTGSGIYLNWGTGRSRGKKVAVNREWKSFFCKGISAGCFRGAEVPGGEKGNLMLPASPAQFC